MPEAVISSTSPLQYLYQLGQFALLPRFYQQVIIPLRSSAVAYPAAH